MVKQLIKSNPKFKKNLEELKEGEYLNIAECFYDTIQGEGRYVGYPAVFLRLQGCTLNCCFCDSSEVWRFGNPYTINELLLLFETNGIIHRLKKGHHLVITGGSPLRQQKALINLLDKFRQTYKFEPFVEIENECVLQPEPALVRFVDCWNNSPKLENSSMPCKARYKEDLLKYMSSVGFSNSWFKFVVSDVNKDWNEIKEKYIKPGLIKKEQIILMPEGVDRDSIRKRYEELVELCCRENVILSDRFHVTIFNTKTGV